MIDFLKRMPKIPSWKKSVDQQRQDEELRQAMERTVARGVKDKKARPDLIPNFQWIIMRVRRQKKITQEKMADDLKEPVINIMRAEMGILPEGEYGLVSKIEDYLNIRLVKDKNQMPAENRAAREPKWRPQPLEPSKKNVDDVTISDLKKMQKSEDESLAQDLWEYTEYMREKEKKKEGGK